MNIQPQLIELCLQKNRKAEYELYKLTYSYLMSICMRYSKCKDTAAESLNLGFLKILTNLNSYNPQIPFKMWIRRIMINTLIDQYRKVKREREHISYVETYYDNPDFTDVNEAIDKFKVEQIYKLIDELPPSTKEVFNLYVIDGYSHKEIGELLNISEGTSKWHLSEARQKLKIKIEDKLFIKL
jgi:RNA polymerase sigma factor (sigma-70 family)